MRFNLAALGLLLTGVLATDITLDFDSIYQPSEGQVVEAGSTVDIAWTINNTAKYGDVKVDVLVIGGKDSWTLTPNDTIATGIDNSDLKCKWHVKKSLGDEKQYGIQIVLSSNKSVFSYSPGFSIKKADDVDSGTDSSTGTTTMTATTESDSASTTTTKTSATKGTNTSTSKSETDSSTTTPTSTTDASSTTVATTPSSTPSNAAPGGPKAVSGVVAAAVGCMAMMAI
ncbi:hypothetical protein PWT90_00690 [Aphanocladium album]|nr:hypothetical protein PWT90_00690 [Aphanocladium album]